MEAKIATLINFAEKLLLASIALLAIVATCQEILIIAENRSVGLADLLLLFIYTEVLGMIGIFFCEQAYSNYFANLYRNYSYYSTDYPTGQGYGHDFIAV